MNKEYLKQLVDEAEAIDPQNEVIWQTNFEERVSELRKNLSETIDYLDTCTQKELDWVSETFEELSQHFKSQKLIDCVERNVTRFPDKELQAQLKTELEYMKLYV